MGNIISSTVYGIGYGVAWPFRAVWGLFSPLFVRNAFAYSNGTTTWHVTNEALTELNQMVTANGAVSKVCVTVIICMVIHYYADYRQRLLRINHPEIDEPQKDKKASQDPALEETEPRD